MIRTTLGRVATAGAAATAASSAGQAHAHSRSVWVQAGTTLPDDRTRGNSLGIEDGWTVAQLQGGDIFFTAEEVDETVNDVFAIASRKKVYTLVRNDSSESMETIDKEADAVIDQANIVPVGDGIQKLERMTKIMLKRPGIQREIMQTFKEEPELKEMVQCLSSRQGCALDPFTFGTRSALPAVDPQIEDITDEKRPNLIQSIVDDIGRGLEFAGNNLAKRNLGFGNFLGRIGRWLRSKASWRTSREGKNEEEDLTPTDRIVGVTLCIASAVMLILMAKRIGVLRVFAHR